MIKNVKVILITSLIGVVYALITDPIALSLNIWSYSEDKILGFLLFGFPIEDLFFFILVPIAISSAVLSFIDSLKNGSLSKIVKKLKI